MPFVVVDIVGEPECSPVVCMTAFALLTYHLQVGGNIALMGNLVPRIVEAIDWLFP